MLLNRKTFSTLFLLLLSSLFIPSVLFLNGSVAEASDDYIVAMIVGRGPKTSAPFRISDPQFRIEYSYLTSTPSFAEFNLFVYYKNHTGSSWYVQETGVSKTGVLEIPAGYDEFYIRVDAYGIDEWEVTIHQESPPQQIPSVDYTPVVTYSGTGDMATTPFSIDADQWKIIWNYSASVLGEFWVFTYPEGETENPVNIVGNSGPSRDDTEYVYTYKSYDTFYFQIYTANIDNWTLTVYEKPKILVPSNITCFVLGDSSIHPYEIAFNGSNQVMGHLSDSIGLPLVNRRVTLTVTLPDNSSYTIVRFTNEGGMFYYELNPSYVGSVGYGSWSVQASWEGDDDFDGAASEIYFFTVRKLLSTLSCSVDRSDYRPGDIVKVTGTLDPPLPGKTIWVIQTIPEGEIDTFTTFVETGTDGTFKVFDAPPYLGSYSFQVSWDGDENFEGATSEKVSYTIRNVTTLSCSVDRSTYQQGEVVTVEGMIDPSFEGRAIDVIITLPNGTQFMRNLASGSIGSFDDSFPISVPGDYTFQAHWVGNDRYTPAWSNIGSFTVTIPPFWMQWWFWLIMTTVFVALGGTFFLLRRGKMGKGYTFNRTW